jgi:hypothetical protein
MRVGHLLPMLQFGTLPADLTDTNMRTFAAEVMPYLRELTGSAPAGVSLERTGT